MPGIFAKDYPIKGNNYVVALEHIDNKDLIEKGKIIKEENKYIWKRTYFPNICLLFLKGYVILFLKNNVHISWR